MPLEVILPKFTAHKNISDDALRALIASSEHQAVRTITDPRNGDKWFWDAALATHAEGASKLDVPYDRPPGAGDILILS